MFKKRSEYAGFIALCLFAALTAFEILMKLFWHSENADLLYGIYILAELVLFAAASIALCVVQPLSYKRFFRLRPMKLSWLPATVFGGLTASVGAALINILVCLLPFSLSVSSTDTTQPNGMLYFLAVILVPAVVEEIFIHGSVMTMLGKRKIASKVFLCALMFAMLHSSGANFLGPFFAALIYGFMTVIYGSVWPAVIAHFLNNIASGFFSKLIEKYADIGINGYIVVVTVILFLILVFIFATMLMRKLKKTRPTTAMTEERETGFPMFLGIFIVLWAVKLVLGFIGII